MIRIGFDGRSLASPAAGVRRYSHELFGALGDRDDVQVVAIGVPEGAPMPRGVRAVPGGPSLPTNPGWMLTGLPRAARGAALDLFHAPSYTAPLGGPRPLVLTIHDVSYERHPEWYPYRRDPIRRGFYRWSARTADRVITDSAFSKREVLVVEAFAGYPARIDRRLNRAAGGDDVGSGPSTDRHGAADAARALVLQLERQLKPGLDAQIGFTDRQSTRLATLDVPAEGGALAVRSDGIGTYRELQVSIRQLWANEQQAFVSYVRSSARGELNDFAALFQRFDAPILRPGGVSRLPTDARDRWIAWGTFNLPHEFVVSPVLEWHSGFPYSRVDVSQAYVGQPNDSSFPSFNTTNYFNPRDVYNVVGTRQFGTFTNSVGPILREFMMIKW